ncbi:hypothetical protein [Aquipuribacter nitratireducens]|uniref:Uncharacterized protein n=1 Tax=Aquipuribacter nitratireducens TaxID=650104 RepID=A0ABW0GMT0_9MICO
MLARLLVLTGALGTAGALSLVPLFARGVWGAWWAPVAFVAVVAAVGYGWTRLLQVPVGWGVGWIVTGTGAVGALVVSLGGQEALAWVPATFAVGVVVAFVHQMGRRDGRPRLVESVSASVTGQAVVLLGTGWLVADAGTGSLAPALVGATGCASAALVMTLPWPRPLTLPLATLAAGLVAGAVGAWVVDGVGVVQALVIGAVAGATTAGLHVLLYRQPTTSHRRAAVSAGAACVMAAGLAVHVGARLTVG